MRALLLTTIHLLCCVLSCYSQLTIDTVLLKKSIADSTSENGYAKLVKKFNETPQFLYPKEGSIIYYGKLFNGTYTPFSSLFTNHKFSQLASKKQFEEAIIEGERILESNPSSIKVLLMLLACYMETKREDKINLTKDKIILLQKAIFLHGKGDSEENTIKVASVEDEYTLISLLKVQTKSRKSKSKGDSMLDIWKIKKTDTGQTSIYFEVLYAYQVNTQ